MKELIKELKFWEMSHKLKSTDREDLRTIIDKMEKQLTIPVVGCSYFTSSDIGSKFKIVKESLDHDFELGETVTLECVSLAEDDQYKFTSENDYWWCGFDDVVRL